MQDGVETLVVVGGDGMVHLALQVLAHTSTALGVIPAGTGNDAARYFAVPRDNPLAATDVVIGGRRRTVDLARTGPTYFLCVLSAGFDAVVNERANRHALAAGADEVQPRDGRRAAHLPAARLHPRPRRASQAGCGR